MFSLKGDVAIITGAGSEGGIGFACASQLGHRGAKVVITSTTTRIFMRVKELQDQGILAHGIVADLTLEQNAKQIVQAALELFGGLSILVNNAGMGTITAPETFIPLFELPLAKWKESIDRNLTTAFLMTKHVLPTMVDRQYGRIVNIASTTGPIGAVVNEGPYASAKAAMVALTKTTAVEHAKALITANAIAPGWIATPAQTETESHHGLASPMGRSGLPKEVASAVTFLASHEASYINGHLLVVDGGNHLIEGLG
ncbi:SDR family NAD(P)-dependent oxidoreductase [Acidithrix ferrooxidans]|uniref:3-oxoacyl-[acyl-carrier-protein] reductase FabG n=1 Tax=Acidithrix ferrooxidans TaxID=1280514 RepID=A0A0D8HG24_9ACTN|nr:SDR family NAD(P)-dependent oxidoreductase [Acidithrix ferrooxidans]KJF16900.1 3-oxoacyl-[acyl-carrier-protein] reductase FabG [Acidithrix ferrooxidans]